MRSVRLHFTMVQISNLNMFSFGILLCVVIGLTNATWFFSYPYEYRAMPIFKPIMKPYPVIRNIPVFQPYPVYHRELVPIMKPVEVPVPRQVPVYIEREVRVPVVIEKEVPVPVHIDVPVKQKVPVPVPVQPNVAVPLPAQPNIQSVPVPAAL